MLSVSVIIPVHEGGAEFVQCLQGLVSSISDADEIIVVADGETDGAWRKAAVEGARIIVNVTSQGPSSARNLGAQAASGDILLFIDADVVVRDDTVSLVREAFRQDPELAAVIGSYDSEPGAAGFLSQYRNLLHHFTHQQSLEDAVTFWGACGAIRRDVFVDSGWFDESYKKACVEDIELGYRLNKAGYKITLRKDIQVKHLKRWSAAGMIRTDVFSRAIPWTELLLSYHTFRNDLNLRFENRFSIVLVFGFLAAFVLGFGAPVFFAVAAAIGALLVALNVRFYRLLQRKHGTRFALQAIPWHWFFYAYSGIGFVLGILRFTTNRFSADVGSEPAVDVDRAAEVEKETRRKWAEVAL